MAARVLEGNGHVDISPKGVVNEEAQDQKTYPHLLGGQHPINIERAVCQSDLSIYRTLRIPKVYYH